MALDLHSPDRPRRFRGDACRHQRAQARRGAPSGEANALLQQVLDACPSPTRMSTIEGETLYRNPASHELYGDRPRIIDYFVNPGDRDELIATLRDKGQLDEFRVRQYDADGKVFWASISARLIEFQGRQVIVSNTTNITDTDRSPKRQTRQANERLVDAIELLAEGFRALRQERLPGAGQQPLPHDARNERRCAGARRQLVRLPARHRRTQPVSGGARQDRRMAGGAGARPPRVPPAGVPAHRRRLVLRLQLPDPRGRLRGHPHGHHRAQARRAGRQGGRRTGPQGAGSLPGQHPDDARP